MYNFNYFSPYAKPKSEKGYYFIFGVIYIVLFVAILVGISIFMKSIISSKDDEIGKLTAEINDPQIAAEIERAQVLAKEISLVQVDVKSYDSLNAAIPYLNAASNAKIDEIAQNILTEDAMISGLTLTPDVITTTVMMEYKDYKSLNKLLENAENSEMFLGATVGAIIDPYYYREHSFEYITVPLSIYQPGYAARSNR